MPDFRVDSVIDIDSVKAEVETLLQSLGTVKAGILDINQQRVTLKSADISSFTQASQQLNQVINDSATATTKATAANQALTKAQIEERLANQQRTAAIKDEILNNAAAAGSYNQLQLQLKQLTAQYKAMGAEERAATGGKELQTNIANTSAQLKIIDASLGNFQRNVGNYNNSLGLLAKGVRGFGGLGVILSNALGIDPSIGIGVEELGRAIRELQHARELQEVGLKADSALYDINTAKIDASKAALDGEVVSTEAVEATQAELAATSEVAGAAQVDLSVKTGVATGAFIAEAGAAEGAAAATVGFSNALNTTAIGAALLALATVIYAVVNAAGEYNDQIKSQEEALEALKTIFGELANATKSYETLRTEAAAQEIKDLTQQIELRKQAGVSALESLALDKVLATQQLKNANEEAERYNVTKETLQSSLKASEKATYTLVGEEQLKLKFLKQTADLKDKNYDADLKRFDDNIALYQKEADAAKGVFTFANDIYQKQVDAKNKIDSSDTQAAKKNEDERRELILAEATNEAEIITSKNAVILSDERSTLAQRLAALKSNQKEQLAVINATLNNTLTDPTKNKDPKLVAIAESKANADRSKANDAYNKSVFDANEAARQRELKAVTDYTNSILTEDKARQQDSLTDRYTDLQSNLDAIKQFGEDEKAILFSNERLQLQKLGLTESEKRDIVEKYNAEVLANDIATNDKMEAANQKAVEDQVATLKYLRDQRIAASNDTSQTGTDISATSAINKATEKEKGASATRKAGIEEKLQQQLSIIDKKGELERLNNATEQLQSDYDFRKTTNSLSVAEDADYQSKIAANKRKGTEIQHEIDNTYDKQKQTAAQIELQSATEVANDIIAINDNKYQKEIDYIEYLQEVNDRRFQKEKEDIQNSTLSNQEKNTQIMLLDKQAAENKKKLDIEEAQIKVKQARFDKDAAIVTIGINTAIAVSKALELGPIFGPPAAIAAGVAGLAQIALVASKPLPIIPSYAKGTENHPGGYALFGEAGKELVEMPNRGSFIADKPMIHDLPKHTKVTPLPSDINNLLYNSMMVDTARKIEEDHSREIIQAIKQGSAATVKAMKKQKGTSVVVNVNGNWGAYINKTVRE